jgi:integrase
MYAELIADWRARGYRLPEPMPNSKAPAAPTDATVGALCLKYITHRESKGGVSPNHLNCIRAAVRIACVTCGHTPVAAFGPLALQEVRDAMLRVRFGKSDQKQWTRSVINRRVRHVVRMFRWGVSKELVPLHLPAALACVEPLRMGEFGVPEGRVVKPVPEAHIDAIREHVSPVVWGMIQVQRYTAARAGEVCRMCPVDIDMTGEVWIYRPVQHKNAHRKHPRTFYLGRRAQQAIAPLLAGRAVDAPLFSARESYTARMRANATKGKPRRKGQAPTQRSTTRKVRDQFTTDTYNRAITRACEKAGVPAWTTHQLRHTASTAARKAFGAEAALLLLGTSQRGWRTCTPRRTSRRPCRSSPRSADESQVGELVASLAHLSAMSYACPVDTIPAAPASYRRIA